MKTSVNMIRKMGDFEVIQRTKDGYFNANALLTQWNTSHPNKRKRQISEFLESSKTKEFIEEIQRVENHHERKNVHGDFLVVMCQRGRNTKKGKTPDKIWMHPYLYIDFAMWINPKFKYHVIKFVYDQLIEYRHNAGDLYKELASAVATFGDADYSQLAQAINFIVFGSHEKGIRQKATQDQLKELNDLQKQLAFLIDMEFIISFEQLMENMRKIWKKRYRNARYLVDR